MNGVMAILGNCRLMSWIVGGLIGLFALVLLNVSFGLHFFLALVLAVIVGGAAAFALPMWFCDDETVMPVIEKAGDTPAGEGDEPAAEAPASPTSDAKSDGPKTGGTPQPDVEEAAPEPKALATPAAPAAVQSGTLLAGEEELAARKGEWRFIPDYDGDGVHEGTDEGTKPATLIEARDGKPDNLKEIKGVGPKMEKMLNEMGFYHFDQIAAWTAQEVAWVDANLQGFHGRVSRDGWVDQAKILAAGGETEFSKRVDDGDVYD